MNNPLQWLNLIEQFLRILGRLVPLVVVVLRWKRRRSRNLKRTGLSEGRR